MNRNSAPTGYLELRAAIAFVRRRMDGTGPRFIQIVAL
jgi:hypothetical protein